MFENRFRKRTIGLYEFIISIPKYIYYRFIKQTKLKSLDEKLSEKIRLEVSKINECKYCFYGHSIVSEYLEIKNDKSLDSAGSTNQYGIENKIKKQYEREKAALDFARVYLYKLNNIELNEDVRGIYRKVSKYFSREQIEKIKTIVFIMNINNRSMNTFEMFIARVTGREKPAKESSFFQELMIVLILSFIAIPRAAQVLFIKLKTKFKKKSS